MTALVVPIQRARSYFDTARSDSLIRNSLYLMASTVVTAGLGYIFWIVTAHTFTKPQVGISSAVISLCSTVSLLTYLGSWATLIERLHEYERSRRWTAILVRMCAATAALTALVALIAVPVLARSTNYGPFFDAAWAILMAIVGSAAWTLLNLFSAAFISARRAESLLSIQTLVSVIKVMLVVPIAATGLGAVGIVVAWVGSALIGVGAGVVWLLPRLRLGQMSRDATPRRLSAPAASQPRLVSYDTGPIIFHTEALDSYRAGRSASHRVGGRKPRHRQSYRPDASFFRRLIGQHLTSVGGAATPLILPTLVVLRLGVTQNAYFYITWMVGAIFFMVSPSVSAALFAESVRLRSDLSAVVVKAFRITSLLLMPVMVIMIAGGKIILGIFGGSYARSGYLLLVLLAASALPDAVSNIAVAIFRVTNRIKYSAVLNMGILVVTLVGSWFLMPSLGIAGVGAAWLGAQVLGAVASFPAYASLGKEKIT